MRYRERFRDWEIREKLLAGGGGTLHIGHGSISQHPYSRRTTCADTAGVLPLTWQGQGQSAGAAGGGVGVAI